MKSSYLTTDEPAAVRLKQLQEELDRSRATTPALAEAAAKSELERREHELADKQAQLADKQAELDAALATRVPGAGAAPPAQPHTLGAGLWLGIAVAAGCARILGGIRHAGAARAAQVRRSESLLSGL